MRVAVTGGAGFIGSAVVERLHALGHEAIVIDKHRGIDIRHGIDLSWSLHGCDACIHLAGVLGTAELFDAPEKAIEANVGGTLNVLRACVDNDCAYVGITMPDAFPSLYTATKICAQRLATAWHHAEGLPVSHVRAFNAFGPGQKHGPRHPQKIIPTFATCAWLGEPLPVWGDGTQTVDLVHVDDVARMLIDAIDHGDDVIFDAGTGVAVSVNEVAETVISICGSSSVIEHLPMRKGEVPTTIVAEGEGWDRLDWKPMLDLGQVIEAVDFYKVEALVAS